MYTNNISIYVDTFLKFENLLKYKHARKGYT